MRLFKRQPKPANTQPTPNPDQTDQIERRLIADLRATSTSPRTLALMDELERGLKRREARERP